MDSAANSNRFGVLEAKTRRKKKNMEERRDPLAVAAENIDPQSQSLRENIGQQSLGENIDQQSLRENPPVANEKKSRRVSLAVAAASIKVKHLGDFLWEIDIYLFRCKQEDQMKSCLAYFMWAFAATECSWDTFLKNSPIDKIAEFPLCHIPEPVYNTAVNWIAQKSTDSLGTFVLWCLDAFFDDQVALSASRREYTYPLPPSQIRVAIFVVLAMVLKGKPAVISILRKIKDDTKYQGHERLPVIVWIVAQAHQGDPVVGMYLWSHWLFPAVCGEPIVNTQSRDLILQLVERMLSGPKARSVLLNHAAGKVEELVPPGKVELLERMLAGPKALYVLLNGGVVGKVERLVPPATLDLLMRITFPLHTSHVEVLLGP